MDFAGFAHFGFDGGFDDGFGPDVPPSTPAPAIARALPDAPGQLPRPPLLLALGRRRLEEARAALEADADAARFPFWDHGVEPPLCAAARLGCGTDMLALLLERGADVKAVDARGRTALDLASDSGADVKGFLADAGAVETLAIKAPVIESYGDFPFRSMMWSDAELLEASSESWSCPPPVPWTH